MENVKNGGDGLLRAAFKAKLLAKDEKSYAYPICPPVLAPGVVPRGSHAPVLAMDSDAYNYIQQSFPGGGFPGFPYLSQLATRPEYRAFASTMSTELTREWIEFTSTQDDDNDAADKIKAIGNEFKRLNVREVIQRASENDCYFGRGQIFLDIIGADRKLPLVLDPRTVKKGSFGRIASIEAVWTTPCAYNALDPVASDFYKPSSWFMLGQEVHASRLLTVVTRPLPDILKPAFNFAGMSLSQLAEPYVDNWLRTRQSVADLINNFSITVLATSMDQVLQGNDDGTDIFARAELFTATRSNKGLMLLDKEREELVQINTPLSGLHELQAQSQEHMCSVSRMPAIVLTGISPSGLNASSDGEIRIFYDWIAAQQEAYWRDPLEIILKIVQLSLFGEIDPNIGLSFVPLYQMSAIEESDIRAKDGATDCAYVAAGIIDPSEVRDRLAKDPNSGYMGLDTSVELIDPNFEAEDKSVSEAQHRAMAAAAYGHSTLGIPKKVGEEFIAKDEDDIYDIDEWEFGSDDPSNYEDFGSDDPSNYEDFGSDDPANYDDEVISKDAEFKEDEHPRDADGEFKSGGSSESGGEKAKELTDTERNKIAQSQALYQKYGKDFADRAEYKAAARSGKLDHLYGEYGEGKADEEYRDKIAKEEKNAAWRRNNLPRLIANKKRREESESAEKRRKVEHAQAYAEAIKSTNKTYLNVPYDDKDFAKTKGAFWDADRNKWFVAGDVPEALKNYVPVATKAPAAGTGEIPKSSSGEVQRTYLNVPYSEKDKAKDKGARWDTARKKWYIVGKKVPEDLESYVATAPKSPAAGVGEMPKSSSPGVQRTYLNVPYAEKDKAKDKGARWDADRKKWYVVGKEVPEGLESYVTNTPKSYSLPTSGLVDENDPSLYGSWLLGHEGEPWASVRNLAPKS